GGAGAGARPPARALPLARRASRRGKPSSGGESLRPNVEERGGTPGSPTLPLLARVAACSSRRGAGGSPAGSDVAARSSSLPPGQARLRRRIAATQRRRKTRHNVTSFRDQEGLEAQLLHELGGPRIARGPPTR